MRRVLALGLWVALGGCGASDIAFLVRGEQVETVEGLSPVERVRVGDRLATPDGPVAVVEVRSATVGEYVRLEHAHGTLALTPGHPVLTARGWVRAGRLAQGDRIGTDGGWSGLRQVVRCEGPAEGFTLRVGRHGYLAEGVLVHGGSDGAPPRYEPPADGAAELTDRERRLERALASVLAPAWRARLPRVAGVRSVRVCGGLLFVENGRRELVVFDATTGELAYRFAMDPENRRPGRRVESIAHTAPHLWHVACDRGVVFTLDRYGNLDHRSALDPWPSSAIAGNAEWIAYRSKRTLVVHSLAQQRAHGQSVSALHGAPLVVGDRLYVGGPGVSAYSLSTGRFLKREWHAEETGWFRQLHALGERLIAVTGDGSLCAFAPGTGELLWRAEIGARADVGEVLGDARSVVVATRDGVAAVDVATGARRWEAPVAVDRLLGLGARHVWARAGTPGARQVVVVARADGGVRRVDVGAWRLWPSRPSGGLIVGSTYRRLSATLVGFEEAQ